MEWNLDADLLPLLVGGVFIVALLYSSVGHAGASGYIAVMSLLSLAPAEIKPIALSLNVLVASIATWQFGRAGHFRWKLFWPFALLATPFAFLGGYLDLPTQLFKMLVGAVLLLSATQLLWRPTESADVGAPGRGIALGFGAGLGLLAGLTGTGGGIFLTPVLILMRWARTANAAAVSAPFILLNSIAGLLGNLSSTQAIPRVAGALLLAAALGGLVGSHLGSRRLPATAIKRLLALVLVIAGMKLLFG